MNRIFSGRESKSGSTVNCTVRRERAGRKTSRRCRVAIRKAALGRAAFPDLDFEDAVGGRADVLESHLERKGTAQLKHAVKADVGFDQDLRRGSGGGENAQKQKTGRMRQADRRRRTARRSACSVTGFTSLAASNRLTPAHLC